MGVGAINVNMMMLLWEGSAIGQACWCGHRLLVRQRGWALRMDLPAHEMMTPTQTRRAWVFW